MEIGNFLFVEVAEFGVHDCGGPLRRLVCLLGAEGLQWSQIGRYTWLRKTASI